MEKVMVTLRSAAADEQWCRRLRTRVAAALSELDLAGLTVNVRDEPVRASMMTLTTLDPPVVAVVSIWTQQYYGAGLTAALQLLAAECSHAAAYLVTESVPLSGPPHAQPSARTPGLANIALLRRPADLDTATWLKHWHIDHTPVAIATQATFGYTQNTVVRALTPDAPLLDGIVEELFPIEAVTNLHAFFGAADDADLTARMSQMAASVARFGADRDIDTVPTSRYVLWTPANTLQS